MSRLVLVAEPIGSEGIELLREAADVVVEELPKGADINQRIGDARALIVRSATQVDRPLLERASQLEVVVRAGTGTDNIDCDTATARGIVVMNTPGGNTNAAVEHSMALMLALARRIPLANRALLEGRWERERWVGWELASRVLGLVGLGRIGTEVASRAHAFRMEVVAYDPFISEEAAGARDIRLLPLDELLRTADVVSLHTPLTEGTRHLLNLERLRQMKRGAHLINCARGGLVDEQALLTVLEEGHLGGAALDVFEGEPRPEPRLIQHPRVVATPHLGASTAEAKASVGIQAARQVLGVLDGKSFENAINVPIRDASLLSRLAPVLSLAERLGALQVQIVEGGVRAATLEIAGPIEDTTPVRLAYLRGLLTPMVGSSVNYVNAPYLAGERGIRVSESRAQARRDFSLVVSATVETDKERLTVRGTVFSDDAPHLVELGGVQIDCVPAGDLLICRSLDRPGVIGRIGTACGAHELNISEFRLGRQAPGAEALSVITLDHPPSSEAVEELRRLPHMLWVKSVRLPPI